MELVCIRCPRGCHLTVTKQKDGKIKVVGNSCPRGQEYGISEMTHPTRIITTIKKTDFGTISLVTDKTVDKNLYFDVLKEIKKKPAPKNPQQNDVFIKNILKSDVNIIISGVNIA